MQSIYDKDVGKLKVVLIIVCVFSLLLVTYSYYHYSSTINTDSSDYLLKVVYNSGKNTCRIVNSLPMNDDEGIRNGLEYNFSVIGYNNTNNDIVYKIYADDGVFNDGIRLDDEDVKLYMIDNKNTLKFGPVSPVGLTEFGILLGEVTISANTPNFINEYTVKLWVTEEYESFKNNDIYADISDEFSENNNEYYDINISIHH